MLIGELAARAGVNVQTLRFYERRGLLKKPARLSSGYRQYAVEAVKIVRFIKRNQALGFSLKEIAALLSLRDQRSGNAAQVRALAEARLRSIDEEVRRLQLMRDELATILDECKCGDQHPMCPAIEELDVHVASNL